MGSELIVSGINSLLPALTSGGAQATTNALAPIAAKAITPAVQQGLQGLLGKQIPVASVESAVASIPVNKTEMVDLFRGISAKTDDELSSYIRDMVDKNITPSTHGGGNFSGEGYNFSIGKDGAEYFAMRKPMEESRAVLKTSVPKDRFIHQNAQNQNRLVDFVQRAEKRGVPVGQAAQEQGKRDMQRYFEKNGILGVKSPEDTVYVINNHDNDWTDNLNVESALRGRREIEPDEELLNKLQSYLGKPLNDKQVLVQQNTLSPAQEEFFKDSKVRDSLGNLLPMYHGTRSDFTVFGDGNILDTSNSHSSVGHWFTPNKAGAKNFADSIWYGDKEPQVMETYLNIKNPKVYETVDNSKAISLLKKELDELELTSGRLSDTKLYSDNMYYASMVQQMINQGNKDAAIKWLAGKQGYDDKTAAKLVDEIAGIKDLADKKKDLQNKMSDLRYGDAYQLFKTDIYREDGQTAEDANVGGIGMALNDKESIKRYVDKLRAEGHDGIIIKGTNYDADVMGGVNDQYVVFDPEQIKNVDNLNPTDNPDIRYALDTYVAPSKTAATDITRIGSANVAPTDPETLPASLRAAQEYLDEGRYIKDIEKFTGKSYPNLTNEDFLDYSLSFKEPEDRELYKRIIEDMVSDGSTTYDKYAASAARNERLMKIFRSKYPDVESKSLMNYLNNHRTQLSNGVIRDIDKELSDRLGIGRSNTFMRDNNVPHDAAGAYVPSETAISIKTDVPEENAVSTLGHERLHSFQTEAELKRYDKRLTSAYSELSNDLDKYLKTPEEIAKRYKTDVEYWSDKNEQQSRMFQQYMENKGYTRGGFADNRAGEWGDEINPAFDKFFKKLRALSKKGIALPSLALLFGGAAVASKEKEKK